MQLPERDTFPELYISKKKDGSIETEQLWAMCLYEHAYDFELFLEAWEKLSFLQKLKFRWNAFWNPFDFCSRVIGAHAHDITKDVLTRFLQHREHDSI